MSTGVVDVVSMGLDCRTLSGRALLSVVRLSVSTSSMMSLISDSIGVIMTSTDVNMTSSEVRMTSLLCVASDVMKRVAGTVTEGKPTLNGSVVKETTCAERRQKPSISFLFLVFAFILAISFHPYFLSHAFQSAFHCTQSALFSTI